MAVINRTTECFVINNNKNKRRCIRFNQQGIIMFVVLLFINGATSTPLETCNLVRNELKSFGIQANAVLDKPTGGQICGQDSCCSNNVEQDLMRLNKQQIDNYLKDSISKFSSIIEFRARKFDALFKDMMNTSKREFHSMFQRTYGKIYLQNVDVFVDFFTELETYYKKGTVRLSETLDNFFGLLYQRMFTVLNSQYDFDEKYLICATDHMIELKPFGDVPKKLTLQLRRSFVATRTYYKALAMAAESSKKMLNIKLDEDCEKELFKMQSCGVCKGQKGQGTCSNYCINVLETCLRSYTGFNEEWDKFIEALDKVAERLVGPYNIEMVVEPLNIKISEAVMNFQEKGTEVSSKIYSLCGKPKANNRRRRSVVKDEDDTSTEYELKYEPIKLRNDGAHHGKKKNKKNKSEDDEGISELEKLIKEIKTKIRETRQFWKHLPYQYCNNNTIAAPPSSTVCYSGDSSSNSPTLANKSNEKVPAVLKEQIYNIHLFFEKLKKAYDGDEVEIIDDSEDIIDNGSGSGDDEASGDSEIKEDGGDDENINNVIVPENNDFEVNVPDEPPAVSTTRPEVERGSTGGAGGSTVTTISLSRALLQYLLPIVLVWFGGAITDLL